MGGFTLVELLIAFVLVALISLLLFSGLRLGMRSWEGVEAAAEYNTGLRLARDFLARVLSQARPISLTLDAQPYLVFAGDSQNLEFVAPLSGQVGIPGLYILRLHLEDAGKEGGRLVLVRWLLHPDVLAGTGEVPVWQPLKDQGAVVAGGEDQDAAAGAFGTSVLLETVEEFKISYFGPPADPVTALSTETEGEWHADWLERAEPPLAVRILLTTPQRRWPELIVWLAAPVNPQ